MRDEIKLELLKVAQELPPEQLPRFFGDLEEIRRTAELHAALSARQQADSDELLTVKQAAELLKVSKDTLYRRDFSFTRHVGRRLLFSRRGIDAAILHNDLNTQPTHGKVTHAQVDVTWRRAANGHRAIGRRT